jgi:pimeloyl-ACP methyl ester carboxylesterase
MSLLYKFWSAAAIALSVAVPFLPSSVSAQSDRKVQVENVVLVHGAWVDGSSWSRVIPLLESKGIHVTAVQLPLTSLADDVAATQRALALIDGPVILVGHSYGGVVITQAGVDPKVKGLVYISAFAPDSGESALSLLKSSTVEPPAASQIVPDSVGFTKISRKGIDEDFAEELPSLERHSLRYARSNFSTQCFGSSGYWSRVEEQTVLDFDYNEGSSDPFRTAKDYGAEDWLTGYYAPSVPSRAARTSARRSVCD